MYFNELEKMSFLHSDIHRIKYENNRKFLKFINECKKNEEFGDWYITVVYISAYHLICSHLAKRETRYLNSLEEKIRKFIPECFDDYVALGNKARFACIRDEKIPTTLIERVDEGLEKIEQSIRDSHHTTK
jgi:hypothetical protein